MSNYKQMELIESTALSADCPVNPIQSQDIDKEVKTLAHYTPTISDCFAQLNHNGVWSKMSQGYSQLTTDGSCETYLEPLPTQGMMQSGRLYHVPKLVEYIKESDCLLLPTPKHTDKNTAGVRSHKQGQTKHLSVAVRKRLKELGYDNEGYHKGYLNPKFVEMMMGFPIYWTDTDFLEISNYPKLLTSDRAEKEIVLALTSLNSKFNRIRLGQLGNAIVPQVGAIMFDLLREILTEKEISGLPKESTIVDGDLSGYNELTRLEEIIEQEVQELKSFQSCAIALIKIRNEKLYTIAGYSSFIGYCYSKFNLSKARVYQLINAVKIVNSIEKSTIVDKNLITESHCRELAKIKDIKERSLVLQKVATEGKITAQAIAKTYRNMKVEAIATKSNPKLPIEGTVVRLTTRFNHDYQKYDGYWGIVCEVREYSIAVSVLNNILPTVHPQDFIVIGKVKGALNLLQRLSKIERSPKIDITVKELLRAIATNSYPELTEWQEKYLDFTEKQLSPYVPQSY